MTKCELSSFIKDCVRQAMSACTPVIVNVVPLENDFCSIAEFAIKFRVTRTTVHNWINTGSVLRKKVNGRTLVKLLEPLNGS